MSIPSEKICPFGEVYQKYWDRRYEIFSLFDHGIKIDPVGLFSAKSELSALRIARCIKSKKILDAFGGVAGSAIGFAMTGKEVICVEKDEARLRMAENNAAIYGVLDKISFVLGDVTLLWDAFDVDSVYFDPPWGGISYSENKIFPLSGFSPNGKELIAVAMQKKWDMAFTVPNNFDYLAFRDLRHDFKVLFDFTSDQVPLYSTAIFDFNSSL